MLMVDVVVDEWRKKKERRVGRDLFFGMRWSNQGIPPLSRFLFLSLPLTSEETRGNNPNGHVK